MNLDKAPASNKIHTVLREETKLIPGKLAWAYTPYRPDHQEAFWYTGQEGQERYCLDGGVSARPDIRPALQEIERVTDLSR